MNKKAICATLVALPLLAVGGLVAANSQSQSNEKPAQVAEQPYVCPVTGEELPCPKCCPLNESKAE